MRPCSHRTRLLGRRLPIRNHPRVSIPGLAIRKVARYLYGCALPLRSEITMPRPATNDGRDKFQRYRETRKTRGMKLLRLWVPNPHAPGFREEAERQALLLRNAPEESDALDFIEGLADLSDPHA